MAEVHILCLTAFELVKIVASIQNTQKYSLLPEKTSKTSFCTLYIKYFIIPLIYKNNSGLKKYIKYDLGYTQTYPIDLSITDEINITYTLNEKLNLYYL